MSVKLKNWHTWTGVYRGIPFEIQHLVIPENEDARRPEENWWSHYISLRDEQVPDALKAQAFLELSPPDQFGRTSYPYMSKGLFCGLDWPGGITYYNVTMSYGVRIVKAGCDYNHSWDEGMQYDLEHVYAQCKKTIDSLREQAPEIIDILSKADAEAPND